jgi:predicted nucleotidyltransferase component of viral defense system
MPDADSKIVDIKSWIDRARRDPVAYAERQATEVVLTAIGSLPGYGSHIFLKGGILMAVVYESPRGTADLDFTTDLKASPDFGGKFREGLDRALLRSAARLGYPDLVLRVQTLKERPRPFGSPRTDFPALKATISYTRRGQEDRRFASGQSSHVVVLDVSFNEPIHAVEVIRLGVGGPSFSAYALTDLIAEKLRALLQQVTRDHLRYRRQDVYDIAHLVTRFRLDESERAAILESFRDKCAARDIVPTIDSLLNPAVIAQARLDWDTILPEIGDLPDFDDCLAKVEALYRSLPWSSDGSQGIDG